MPSYQAPIRDMQFVLHEVLRIEDSLLQLPGQQDHDPELIDAVLTEVGKICEEVIAPLNQSGDAIGCVLENGVVRPPPGFQQAYKTFTQAGFASIAGDVHYGGQGLPKTINIFADEMVASANMSFGLYLILTFGASLCIGECASDELKRKYLPNLVQGDWTGTMCLTEPHCGTDLGLSRTKAVAQDDGSYLISGTKIFITAGDHDLSDNIIHLVLARTPDAPAGVRGISLFLVPKFLVNEDGSLGRRNGVAVGSIEEKMGTHGAPACLLNFDDALGYLVGDLNRGVRNMFTMMNHERLVVGVQGLGQGEVAYQNAVAYAKERLQGRHLAGARHPDKAADPIIVHPDVRRLLLNAKAYNEGARAFAGWIGLHIDYAHDHPDAAVREISDDLVALLTPVVKGVFTDNGSEATIAAQQVFGGHGYIREWGMEQFVRDVRITQIYEGTNGVQALDLVARKLPMNDGRLIERYLKVLDDFLLEHAGVNEMMPFVNPLQDAVESLKTTTLWVRERSSLNPVEAGAASSDYMKLIGLVSLGFMWTKMAAVAIAKLKSDDDGFYATKLSTARYFMQRILPQHLSLAEIIRAGSEPLMAMDEHQF